MKISTFILIISSVIVSALILKGCRSGADSPADNETRYKEIQNSLKRGWGTFNNHNVLSHVLMPEGFALNVGLKIHENGQENYLKSTLIASRGSSSAVVTPGYKSLDGSYSDLTVRWNGLTFRVESATTANNDLLLIITPLKLRDSIPSVVLESGILWNLPGRLELKNNTLLLSSGKKKLVVRTTGELVRESLSNNSPYLAVKLDKPVAFYTGTTLSLDQVKNLVEGRRSEQEKVYAKYGSLKDTYAALQGAVGWNIIYDASKDRVIFPVSRIWTETFGGQYVLFDWDTYFGAMMAGLESKDLAYANAVEITRAITPGGFVPNFSGSYGSGSFDRSQPPVGSMVFKELYKKYKDKWLLEYVFDDLMKWNRWWPQNRDFKGLLCWGSSPVSMPLRSDFATDTWQGAAYESGLDNSPMFDHVPFNKQTHLMEQADAGLTGLYVMDCDALGEIALIIGNNDAAKELKARADKYRENLAMLWDEKTGIYRNKRTDTGLFSNRLSPTNFYPLLAHAPSQEQAERMVSEHLMNPDEFYGEWMIPSISRNDTAFLSQNYWRGRIWGPMNFLVYMGLRNYDLPAARKILAEKSGQLMMENVRVNGYIYENYNALTGNIKDLNEAKMRGDCYYHWGALLGLIGLMEEGYWEK